jgi:uncharacterized repeat protein (TIGR03803 family)
MSSNRFVAAIAALAPRLSSFAALAALPFAAAVQAAPAVSTVVAFSGSSPSGNLVLGSDGALYGTAATTTSVTGGLIYRVTTDGSSVKTIHQLVRASEGQTPQAGLLLASDGKFYGTTRFGKSGTSDTTGTVFRLSQDGADFAVLYRFAPFTESNDAGAPKNTDGAYPGAELIEGSDGDLYGITGAGGANGTGVVFKIGKDGTGQQVLHTFAAVAGRKVAKVVKSATAAAGAGTTVSTGASQSVATIPFDATHTRMTVRVHSPTANIKVRLKVEDASNSAHSAETEATTSVANGWSTLTFDFANPASGTPALDFSYTYNKISIYFNYGTSGTTAGAKTYYFDDVAFVGDSGSFSPITFDAPGVTYTLTGFSGAEDSTVVTDPTGQPFENADGMTASGPLLQASDGKLYGTTSAGGTDGRGTVFRLNTDGTGFEVLHTFTETTIEASTSLLKNTDGAVPLAGLVEGLVAANDHNLYGTASEAGPKGYGTIFRIAPDGSAFTVLHSFDNAAGARPATELALFSDGRFYGSTISGGASSSGTTTTFGTLFSMAPDGTGFTVVHSLDGSNGSAPASQLIELSNSRIVSSAAAGANCGSGSIFLYDPAGGTVTGDTKCGRKKSNSSGGGGATAPAVLLLLGGLSLARRRRR